MASWSIVSPVSQVELILSRNCKLVAEIHLNFFVVVYFVSLVILNTFEWILLLC